jgi:hypothetical protein
MSYVTVRKLLEVRLNTVGGVFPTAYENAPFKPVSDPWQQVFLLPARTENPTMGDGFKRETGVFQVTLHYPNNTGPAPATQRAELLRAGFPRGLTLTEGNVRVMIDEAPYIGPGASNGTWFDLPVSVPYVADVN